MAKKTALVLSGGGAKGAFQFMAEKYAREVKGYKWDVIAGVSVGALNALMLAMEKYERLDTLWNNISADQVMTGKFNVWTLLKMVFGARSIYGNEPLRQIIEAEYQPELIKADLRIGAVSLTSSEYVVFKPGDPNFVNAVLASTAIPIVWTPVQVSEQYSQMVDGGVRNISPLGDVLDSDPDEIVIINCSPKTLDAPSKGLNNVLNIGMHALDIALNEIFITDVREFTRINLNVQEAQKFGVTLHNEKGKAFKYYDFKLIEPDYSMGDTLDFSQETIQRRMKHGWEKAKAVLGE